MTGFQTLIHLVRSLSKTEKKNFRLFSGSQVEGRSYIQLYDLINSFDGSYDEMLDECRKKFPGTEFNTSVNYLYNVLMKSLILLNQQNGTEETLMTGIQEVKLLFRKGLPEDGFYLLEKLLKLAVKFEKFDYCIILDKLKLHYLNRHQFQDISEEELLRLQTMLRKHIQYELNLTEHASLYELLSYRFVMRGIVRSQKDKEKLNDLVFIEMNLAGNPRYQSFNLKKNHLLFQSVYFMMTGDNKSSLSTYYELNKLFEDHRQLWLDSPIYYIQHLKGILNNLHITGQYAEMAFFIAKLEELQSTSQVIMLRQTVYVSKLKEMIGMKDYSDADALIVREYDGLSEINQLQPGDRAEVILYTSLAKFYKKDFKHAARLLRQIIHLDYMSHKQNYRMLKLINLITHFELHDFNYLSSGVHSLERNLKQSKRTFLTENVILKLLKKYPQALSRNARKTLFETTLRELSVLKADPYERQLFHVFDFEEWVEGKLEGIRTI